MSKELEALEYLEHIEKDDFNMILATYPPIPAYNGISKYEMFNKIGQALIKAQEQEKVLSIIFKKGLPLPEIDIIKQSKDYKEYCIKYSWLGKTNGVAIQKTQEEFKLLKEMTEC